MMLNVEKLPLALVSPSVAGAALKILQLGGSSLPEDKMRRAMGSAYLFSKHKDEILDLVKDMESATQE